MTCLHIFSAILSLIAAIFFIIGCAGNSEEKDTLEQIPWGIADVTLFTGDSYYYFGTSAYYVEAYDVTIKYDDCDTDWCDTCLDVGATAIGLTAVAFILVVVTLIINALQAAGKDGVGQRVVAIICTLIAAVFGLIAIIVFRDCYADFIDEFAGYSGSAYYGTSGWLVIAGFIVAAIASFLNMLSFCCCVAEEPKDADATGVGM
jgi:hypothetical protein